MKLAICVGVCVLLSLCATCMMSPGGIDWVGVLCILTAYTFGVAIGFDAALLWHQRVYERERNV